MTLRSLEVFLAVVEAGSMRAAAERLYISQPSVSGMVADLENEFGVRLFERLGKRLFLTQAGERLSVYARRMLSLNAEIARQMGGIGNRLPLRIGASVTIGSSVITELIRRLAGPVPYVFVGNTGMIEKKLLRSELDAALVEGRIDSEDLIDTPVIRDRLMLICNREHRFAGRSSVRMAELAGERLVMREPESGTRHVLDQEFALSGVAMNVVWECNNSQAILHAVRAGFGVSILSPRLLRGEDALLAVPIADGAMQRWFSLVIHKDKLIHPALQAFIDLCRSYE